MTEHKPNPRARLQRLEDDKLWRLASELAVYAYGLIDLLPEEERYGIGSQLRDRSFDLTAEIAEAAGSIDPRDKIHSYGHALREAYGVRNGLLMADRTGQLEVEPAAFVKLDRLTAGLTAEIDGSAGDIPEFLKQFSLLSDDRHDAQDGTNRQDRKARRHED